MAGKDDFLDLDSPSLREIDQETKIALENLPKEHTVKFRGIGNRRKLEKIPEFNQTTSEKVFKGEGTNSFIVLGRDRPQSPASGYGGIGATQCGAIDIVCGRVGDWKTIPQEESNEAIGRRDTGSFTRRVLVADNDFVRDAARIYISERADIDDYFGIASGKAGGLNGLSAIGIKADSVRIIAREGIKLVTRTDENNSKGGNNDVVMGIDLIAGNNDSGIQPLVKGENMKELMRYVVEDIRNLASMIHSVSLKQAALETMLAAHTHPSAGAVALPSMELAMQCTLNQVQRITFDVPAQIKKVFENVLMELAFLRPGFDNDKYICSMSNHTN